jgi:hypothetical protein
VQSPEFKHKYRKRGREEEGREGQREGKGRDEEAVCLGLICDLQKAVAGR